jgi:hypothetical protein
MPAAFWRVSLVARCGMLARILRAVRASAASSRAKSNATARARRAPQPQSAPPPHQIWPIGPLEFSSSVE